MRIACARRPERAPPHASRFIEEGDGMKLTSASCTDGARIPGEFAFCLPAAEGPVCLGANRNPQLAWSEVPAGPKSGVLICHDPDLPSRGDDVDQAGRSVPAGPPRLDLF